MPGSTSAIPPTVPAALAAPHASAADAVAAALGVDPTIGLADDEAVERLARYGPNVLSEERRHSSWAALIEAVTEPFVLLLLAAGGLAVLVGEVRDGTLVLLGLLPIVGADIVTSYRAERALQTLRDAAAPMARVRRGAAVREEPSVSLVPGDIVLLRIGEIVPADIRLLRADALLADASALTGESVPELASSLPDAPHAVLAERRSMVYGGTGIVGGHGEGIVVATGAATEVGRIAGSLTTAERRRSPLQRELDRLVRILVVVATVLITITTASVFLRQGTIGEAVIAGVSAAIAAIPEEPPVLLAVILGLGAFRLLRRGVLVRRLSAQETLGAIDLIITDKTGTLTMNRISVGAVLTPDGEVMDRSERARLIGGALRAEADAWQISAGGSPGSFTRALLAAADGDRELDPGDLVSAAEPTQRKPYSETWSREEGRIVGWAIGAPEAILALPSTGGGDTAAWHDAVEDEAERGGRLLLLSSALSPDVWRPEAVIVFADPLRDGVTEAIATA
ncbi:MAG: HAD-IC family P-type ATPase, partial [Candidatus Limnocylindrales bacterium]